MNKELICKFFTHKFVKKLWVSIYQQLEKGDKKVVINNNPEYTFIYRLVTEVMDSIFEL